MTGIKAVLRLKENFVCISWYERRNAVPTASYLVKVGEGNNFQNRSQKNFAFNIKPQFPTLGSFKDRFQRGRFCHHTGEDNAEGEN